MKEGRLQAALSQAGKVGLDTSVLIYHFEGNPRYAGLTSLIFSKVAGGLEAVLSTLAIMELLVKPFQSHSPKVVEGLVSQLKAMPNFRFVPPGFDIAVEAARIRARSSLRPPDALHLATSLMEGADVFITNDGDFRPMAGKERAKILLLDDCL